MIFIPKVVKIDDLLVRYVLFKRGRCKKGKFRVAVQPEMKMTGNNGSRSGGIKMAEATMAEVVERIV